MLYIKLFVDGGGCVEVFVCLWTNNYPFASQEPDCKLHKQGHSHTPAMVSGPWFPI